MMLATSPKDRRAPAPPGQIKPFRLLRYGEIAGLKQRLARDLAKLASFRGDALAMAKLRIARGIWQLKASEHEIANPPPEGWL